MRFARSVPRDFWRQAGGGNALQARQEGPQAARRVEVMLCHCRALLRLVRPLVRGASDAMQHARSKSKGRALARLALQAG